MKKKNFSHIAAFMVAVISLFVYMNNDIYTYAKAYENNAIIEENDKTTVSENSTDIEVIPLAQPSENKVDLPHPVGREISKEEWNQMIDAIELPIGDIDELSVETQVSLPASYDARQYGKVTSVKNQYPFGLCWDYSMIAAMESALISQGYETSSVDLSELHAAYACYDYYVKRDMPEAAWFNLFCMNGGNSGEIIFTMSLGMGPVYETDLPMPADSNDVKDDYTISDEMLYKSYYEPNKKYAVNLKDKEEAKQLIMNLGGACASYYHLDGYYKDNVNANGDSSYYFPYDMSATNHAVEIVGWDDDFSASNFKITPPGNGAWLIKNSWGENGYATYNGTGYYWISYYDGHLKDELVVACEFTKSLNTHARQITLSDDEVVMQKNMDKQLSWEILPATTVDKSVSFESSDESVATVDANGLIHAVSVGECEITAKALGNIITIKDICKVKVEASEISVDTSPKTIRYGTKLNLNATLNSLDPSEKILYSVSGSSVAVDESGNVTTTGYGSSTVFIKSTDTNTPMKKVVINVYTEGFIVEKTEYEFEYDNVSINQDVIFKTLEGVLVDDLSDIGFSAVSSDVTIGTGGIALTKDRYIMVIQGIGECTYTFTFNDSIITQGKDMTATIHVVSKAKETAQENPDTEDNSQTPDTQPTPPQTTVPATPDKPQDQTVPQKETVKSVKVGNVVYYINGNTACVYKPVKKNVTSVIIPSIINANRKNYKVTCINKNAFSGCKKLKKVTIGTNVTAIKSGAFKDCKKLTTIIIKSTKLKSVSKDAFKGIKGKITVKVPKNKQKKYQKLFKGKLSEKSVVK